MTYFNPQTIFDAAMFVIVVVAAVATWQNSKSAKKTNEETNAFTTIQLKDAAILALQQEVERINKIVVDLGNQITALKTELKVKNETIERYLQLIQNRNPELEVFIKNTNSSILLVEKTLEQILKFHQTQPQSTVTVNN